ncbi:hypothetical protein KBY58_01345 [Cyanobium sp. HWJ4-Hawea]|uniref:hypothetical protein n=1 Tax=unclassified Cyanobium TaxID=2627006 RepID=UPI0020CEA3A4|nr:MULTISPECIES: hypothetical protein [unclassified Cyanobium]MCP9775593.1 hypothetical protein [Cyanobium sp. WAJ14-Wanaka]MCP9808077.1 hypothetical protein [Cyanobium sp. HWJ4-Hawea]
MAVDPLDSLRLKLMQDVLPVGLAMAGRARKGGAKDVVAAFQGGDGNPLEQLRQEGEVAASQVREQLDRLSPGLGNPVMKVSVRDVPPEQAPAPPTELQERLQQIGERLQLLEQRLGAP